MEKTTLAFIGLLSVLIVGGYLFQETFVDISDNSGSKITLTLAELMSLIGNQGRHGSSNSTTQSTQPVVIQNTPPDYSNVYDSIKGPLLTDVKKTVQDELLASAQSTGMLAYAGGNGSSGSGSGSTDSCASVMTDGQIDSAAQQQGTDWMRYVPGRNPNDYIRKDSIPCYGCTL
jgi:hypothetical protein